MTQEVEGSNGSDQATALKRYDLVLRYLATENQIFWNRSQLFLVANAALAGFAIKDVPTSLHGTPLTRLIFFLAGSLVGVIICTLWLNAIKSGLGWNNHWKSILKKWEKDAFGDENLFRETPNVKFPSSSGVARKTAWLFFFLWIAVALYISVCIGFKWHNIELP